MSWDKDPRYHRGSVRTMPWFLSDISIAQGTYYTIGDLTGDDQTPGARYVGDTWSTMRDVFIRNSSAKNLYIGSSIHRMQFHDEYTIAGTAYSRTRPDIKGPTGAIVFWNPLSAAAATGCNLHCNLLKQDLGTDPGEHPGHVPEMCGFMVGDPNAAATSDLTARVAMTITHIKLWAPKTPLSSAGTYLLTIEKNATANLLAAANYNLESLTASTVKTMSLTATTADLALAAGDEVNFVATSDNADLATADFIFEVFFTV